MEAPRGFIGLLPQLVDPALVCLAGLARPLPHGVEKILDGGEVLPFQFREIGVARWIEGGLLFGAGFS